MIRLRRDRSEDVINHNFYGNRKKAFEKELLLEDLMHFILYQKVEFMRKSMESIVGQMPASFA